MWGILAVTWACALGALVCVQQAVEAQPPCQAQQTHGKPLGCYDIASGTYTGEMLRGPATITAFNLNTIRYDYQFGSATNYQAAQNLWSGLSAMATQAPTVTAPQTAAPGPQPQLAKSEGTRLATPPRRAPRDKAFAPVQEAMTRAQTADKSFRQVNEDLSAKLSDFSSPLTKLAVEAATLKRYQDQANTSTGLVTQGGAALTAYLSSTSDITSELVEATKGQLANNSPLIEGIQAKWPDSDKVVDLENSLADDANALNNASNAFSSYASSELPVFQAALAALTTAQAQINTAFSQFKASNQPNQQQQGEVDTELGNLAQEIKVGQPNLASLNQMSALFTAAIAQCVTASTSAAALSPSSSTYSNFAAAQAALVHWRDKMASILDAWNKSQANPPGGPDPFAMSRSADCGFAFSRTKDTVVTLTRIDLTPGLSNPTAQTVLTVTVECTSPFSLSAGVAFSTIPDNEFAVAPTPGTVGTSNPTNTIYQTSASRFHPLPLAMVNARFAEPNEHVAFYGSFGIAANIRDQSAGGSTAEYLMGPSVGLFRTMIFTAGVHLGSRASVGQGYTVNGTAPTTLTTAPINTSYTAGFGLGISFTTP